MPVREVEGVIPAMITPFKKNEDIDFDGLRELTRFLVENGVHGLLPAGTTGEGHLMTFEEVQEVTKAVLDEVNGKVPVVGNASSPGTAIAAKRAKALEDLGCELIMAAPPYYLVPQEEGIIAHYKHIAEATNLPIMIYNSPGATGVNLDSRLVELIFKAAPSCRYCKHSNVNIFIAQDVLRRCERKVKLIAGNNHIVLPILQIGGVGMATGAPNLFPKEHVEMYEAFRIGDVKKAEEIYWKFFPLYAKLFFPGVRYIERIKAALDMMNLPGGYVRKPRLPVNEQDKAEIKAILAELTPT